MSATAGLFIDADNVDADVIAFALDFLRERGLRVTVRRAYGGHERLGTAQATATVGDQQPARVTVEMKAR